MSQLATLSSSELRKLSSRELTAGLEEMTPAAIDRFKRMRKLTDEHTTALTTFLRQHPEKRLTAGVKLPAKPKPKSAPKKAKHSPARSSDDGYVQLWSRVRSWWDGEPIPQQAQKPFAKKPNMAIEVDTSSPESLLAERLDIIQKLWGTGNSLPGGETMTLKLLKGASPTADTLIADLSAGLGGGVRHLASTLGSTVHGFERDKDLATAGQIVSDQTDFSEKATILSFNPDKLHKVLDKLRYDIVFTRDLLCYLPDRKTALSVIGDSLKPNGSLVFTDLVLADRSTEKKAILEWRQSEPAKPYPATMDEYRELLLELRFDVKAMDDASDAYVSAIQDGWKAMVESLKSGSFSRTYVDALMTEGKVWLARSRALESGQLRLVHGRAVMQKGPKRSLTDSMSID